MHSAGKLVDEGFEDEGSIDVGFSVSSPAVDDHSGSAMQDAGFSVSFGGECLAPSKKVQNTKN